MVEHVQILEHHSLAHAGLDIPVTAAKLMVSIIFKNVLEDMNNSSASAKRECFHTLFSSVWISR
jgi:hypothetical protein